jgi:putative hydrolase of the HAD superfamily
MNRIHLITLDLDNTLWDVDSIIIKAEQDMVGWLADHVPECLEHYQGDSLNEVRQQVFARYQDRSHDLSFMRTQVLYEVIRRAGVAPPEARTYAEQAFDVFFEGRNRVEFFPGALDMLEDLSSRFRIYALTNGNAHIEKAGLTAYLSGAYSSADVGAKKPHPDMFHAPLRELDLNPQQAVHVGDHLVDDIHGANAVGMHSIWVNLTDHVRRDTDSQPTREVDALAAVVDAVDDINSLG